MLKDRGGEASERLREMARHYSMDIDIFPYRAIKDGQDADQQ